MAPVLVWSAKMSGHPQRLREKVSGVMPSLPLCLSSGFCVNEDVQSGPESTYSPHKLHLKLVSLFISTGSLPSLKVGNGFDFFTLK